MAPPPPRITVGVPVFRGESMVADALRSLQAQTLTDFKVVISVDGADAASAAVCRTFEHDPRFRTFVQPERLGWYGNFNWITGQLDTEFFIYLAHDDCLAPECLQSLVAHADRHPEAKIVYSDMRWFGGKESIQHEAEIDGDMVGRALEQLRRCTWLPFHGLHRADLWTKTGPLVGNPAGSALEDVVWVTKALRYGPSRRLADPLYLKRRHPVSVTATQEKWALARRREVWLQAWGQLLAAALRAAETPDHARRMLRVALRRLAVSAPDLAWLFDPEPLGRRERRQLVDDFLDHLQRGGIDLPARLGIGWDAIRRVCRRQSGLGAISMIFGRGSR